MLRSNSGNAARFAALGAVLLHLVAICACRSAQTITQRPISLGNVSQDPKLLQGKLVRFWFQPRNPLGSVEYVLVRGIDLPIVDGERVVLEEGAFRQTGARIKIDLGTVRAAEVIQIKDGTLFNLVAFGIAGLFFASAVVAAIYATTRSTGIVLL